MLKNSIHWVQGPTKVRSKPVWHWRPSANPTHQILNSKLQSHFPIKNCLPGSRSLFLSYQFFIGKRLWDSQFKIWCVGLAEGLQCHIGLDLTLVKKNFENQLKIDWDRDKNIDYAYTFEKLPPLLITCVSALVIPS